MFERLMERLVQTERFIQHPELVSLCVEEASEISATPFISVLTSGTPPSAKRSYAALQALKTIRDPRIIETCHHLLPLHPDALT